MLLSWHLRLIHLKTDLGNQDVKYDYTAELTMAELTGAGSRSLVLYEINFK